MLSVLRCLRPFFYSRSRAVKVCDVGSRMYVSHGWIGVDLSHHVR